MLFVLQSRLRASKFTTNFCLKANRLSQRTFSCLSEEELGELAAIYNSSIESATIDAEWLHSSLIIVPKTFKYHTQIQGNWVITMQNTTGKLLEKKENYPISLRACVYFHLPLDDIVTKKPWLTAVFVHDVYEGFHSGIETCAAAFSFSIVGFFNDSTF